MKVFVHFNFSLLKPINTLKIFLTVKSQSFPKYIIETPDMFSSFTFLGGSFIF